MALSAAARRLAIFLGAIALVQGTLLVRGQEAGPHKDTYSVMRADQTLTVLPSVAGVSKSKSKLIGMAGSKAYVQVPGDAAAVRLRASDPQTFVVKLQHGTVPETLRLSAAMPVVQLHRLDAKKGDRIWVISNVTSYGVYAKSSADFQGVPVDVSRYEPDGDAVQIVPRARLAPGEYAFVTIDYDAYQGQSFRFHCFGVDP